MAKKIQFRGAKFRHIDLRVGDSGCFARCYMESDITPELAEEFGWEIYSNGHLISGLNGATKLSGELNLKELSFNFNGNTGDPLETTAVIAKDFQLARRKGDTGGTETLLRFTVRSSDWKAVSEFFGPMGQVDGALKLELAPDTSSQRRLGEESNDDDSDGESDAEEKDNKPARKTRGERPAPAVSMEKVQ